MPGHSVLQLSVAALEEWVVARTRHYDEGFIATDPRFGHAHITALGPFDPRPDTEMRKRIGELASATAPLALTLGELGQFPNGIIHLKPAPAAPVRALTDRLVAAFPAFVPYGGRFGARVEPHLTLDAASEVVSLESTAQLLGDLLPLTCVLTELQLAWWESGNCHVQHTWQLG